MLLNLSSFTLSSSERRFSRISLNSKVLASMSPHYIFYPFLMHDNQVWKCHQWRCVSQHFDHNAIWASPTVTPRRWLDQCNPELSNLITKKLKLDKSVWLKNLTQLEDLLPLAEDKKFRKEWATVKQRNKERLARYVQLILGFTIRTDAMFDVQIKVRFLEDSRIEKFVLLMWHDQRMHEYKVPDASLEEETQKLTGSSVKHWTSLVSYT